VADALERHKKLMVCGHDFTLIPSPPSDSSLWTRKKEEFNICTPLLTDPTNFPTFQGFSPWETAALASELPTYHSISLGVFTFACLFAITFRAHNCTEIGNWEWVSYLGYELRNSYSKSSYQFATFI